MTENEAIEKAQVLAISSQKIKLVIEIDDDPNPRKIIITDYEYPDYDEFEAFAGSVLAQVNPDGSVE